jgi:hypothetical protein
LQISLKEGIGGESRPKDRLTLWITLLPNLIFEKTPIQKGKGRNEKRGPISNQETAAKSANAQTGVAKKQLIEKLF